MAASASIKKVNYRLDDDGRVNLSALNRIQHYSRYPKRQLSIGLNSHLRNAYSHDRYRILDGGVVEWWDVDPRTGRFSWGPETWSLAQIEEACETLWRNCLGLCYAYALFSINCRQLIEKTDLFSKVRTAHDPVRAEELRGAVLITRLF